MEFGGLFGAVFSVLLNRSCMRRLSGLA